MPNNNWKHNILRQENNSQNILSTSSYHDAKYYFVLTNDQLRVWDGRVFTPRSGLNTQGWIFRPRRALSSSASLGRPGSGCTFLNSGGFWRTCCPQECLKYQNKNELHLPVVMMALWLTPQKQFDFAPPQFKHNAPQWGKTKKKLWADTIFSQEIFRFYQNVHFWGN